MTVPESRDTEGEGRSETSPAVVLELDIGSLVAFDTIRVWTKNSEYSLCLLDPQYGRVIVQGGFIVADLWEAHLVGRITVGSCLRFLREGSRVRTSRVRSFRIERRGTLGYPLYQ